MVSDITTSTDITELLSMLPDSTEKSAPTEVGDLNQAHYQSSSSGNSSPARDAEPLGPITVEDIDMWEVLDCLEGPKNQSPADKDLAAMARELPHSSSPGEVLLLDEKGSMMEVGDSMEGTLLSPTVSPAQPSRAASKGGVGSKRPALEGAGSKRPAPKVVKEEIVKKELLDDSDDGGPPMLDEHGNPLDPNEEKRLKRMRRNRESAAMSRNRKKMYIEELEARVVELSANVAQLQQQNDALKAENAQLRSGRGVGGSAAADADDSGDGDVRLVSAVGAPSAAPPAGSSSDNPLTLAGDGGEGADDALLKGEERAGAPGGASGGKKGGGVSTASLALMSALTFVTFSAGAGVGGRGEGGRASPGARALMSLERVPESVPESLTGLLRRARGGVEAGDEAPLWPALKPIVERSGLLPSPEDDQAAAAAPSAARALPQPEGAAAPAPSAPTLKLAKATTPSRVIKLPQNSSWGDALRFEALEASLARRVERAVSDPDEERALVHHEATTHDAELGAEWSKPTRVYDPLWKVADDEDDDPEADAQRYIFCSRAYMFDAVAPLSRAARRTPAGRAAAPPSPLPSAMPARFRHAAQQQAAVPQLTDGNASGAAPAAGGGPTVQFLLPSAALHGVFGASGGAGLEEAPPRAEDLMQVTCQVTNVSRVA